MKDFTGWRAVDLADIESLVSRELADCSAQLRSFFEQVRIFPVKWRQSPWGDQGGGFWAVAVCDDRVLWYNDIEEGFNVSRFINDGEIPSSEYWCNQDELRSALHRLQHETGGEPPDLRPPIVFGE